MDTNRLNPQLEILEGQDTAICFSIPESRVLAKKLSFVNYCDTLLIIQEGIISHKDSVISRQSIQLDHMKDQNINYQKIIINEKTLSSRYKEDILVLESLHVKDKKHNNVLKVAVGILVTGLIIK